MTPTEFHQFLNTPKASLALDPKNHSLDKTVIVLAGITLLAVGCAVYLYLENEELKKGLKGFND